MTHLKVASRIMLQVASNNQSIHLGMSRLLPDHELQTEEEA
jgi:hypothetical protein